MKKIIGISIWSMLKCFRGSAIAKIVGRNAASLPAFDDRVTMYVYEEMINGKKLTEIINETHENVKYLPGHILPPNVVSIQVLKFLYWVKKRIDYFEEVKVTHDKFEGLFFACSFYECLICQIKVRIWKRHLFFNQITLITCKEIYYEIIGIKIFISIVRNLDK